MRSYSVSMRGGRLPDGQKVATGVFIAVMDGATVTRPSTPQQRHLLRARATLGVQLAGREEALDLDSRFAVHRRIDLDPLDEATNAGVARSAGRAADSNEAAHIEVFDADQVIVADQSPREMPGDIVSRLTDCLGDAATALALPSVSAPVFLLARKALLSASEAVRVALAVLGTANTLAAGEGREPVHGKVDPARLARLRQWRRPHVDNQRNERAPPRLLGDRYRRRFERNVARPSDLEVTQPGEEQLLAAYLEARGGERLFGRLTPRLALARWIARALVREVAKPGLQVAQCLLHGHAGDFVEPDAVGRLPQQRERHAGLVAVHGLAATAGARAFGQKVVVEVRGAERASKNPPSLRRRVAQQAPALFHACALCIHLLTTNRRRAFPPALNGGLPSANIG